MPVADRILRSRRPNLLRAKTEPQRLPHIASLARPKSPNLRRGLHASTESFSSLRSFDSSSSTYSTDDGPSNGSTTSLESTTVSYASLAKLDAIDFKLYLGEDGISLLLTI